ncbi:MAG: alanine racemase [Bryobacterales bacterium]|nr:alanine racemase [Bryobacterales bacterium]
MQISELETPALLIDLDIFERNLKRAADYTRQHGLRLRPHTKTHKVPEVGRRQIESGAVGLTVAKVGEAEVMLRSGTPDLLVAYPVIGASKLRRLAEVARQTRVTVALDSEEAARSLSTAAVEQGVGFGVLAEMDVGLGRVGVTPGPDVVALAKFLQSLPGLSFEGITFYPGHIKKAGEDGASDEARLSQTVRGVLDLLRHDGIVPNIVSGGSTPSLFDCHTVDGLTEIRPGTYVYNDVNTVVSGACTFDDCAVSILVTVVSTARPNQMIIDGGSKTFSSDRLVGSTALSFGRLVEAPGAVFCNMNEEHGYVNLEKAERRFAVGDRVRMIPNHVCAAVNLHENVYGVRNGTVEVTWQVEGRGKLQ